MPSDETDLSVVLESQQKRDLAPNVISKITGELKDSLTFQYNWGELLQSAPTSLSSLGACFVASSSSKASVTLTPPKDKGFQYLSYTFLQANLMECGNLGRLAFVETERGMGKIQLASRVISSKVNDVVQSLGDPSSAKKLLKPQLNTIKSDASECFEAAIKIDKKFEDWLLYACELHAACVEQESTTRESLLSNKVCLAAEQTRLDYQKATVETAENASKVLGKQVELAGQAFKKASDEFPTGRDLMGQQIVGDLANCVTTALAQAIPALIDNMNPVAKAKAGANIVGGFLNSKDDSKGVSSTAVTNGTPTSLGSPSPSGMPPAVPPMAADPAYSEVLQSATYLAALSSIINGEDGNIDWELARGDGADANVKSSVKFLSTMLSDCKTRFSRVATNAEPSVALTTVLDVTSRIAKELTGEVEKFSGVKQAWPAKDSSEVKKWQTDFAVQYIKANGLAATARSLPGGVGRGIPLMTADPAVQTAQINAKTAQAQAVLEAAKNRLSTTEDLLTKSQENYVKASEILVEQKNKLGEIQANLSRLTASNLGLTEIKAILIECIKLVISLKQQITNLVRFFKAMSTIVEMSIRFHVDPFLETVKALVAADGTDPNKDLKIGNFTLTDLQRSQTYSAVIVMRSYFAVFGDIAKMWTQISSDYVMPGLRLCDDLSVTTDGKDPGQMQNKTKALESWSREASDAVAKIASEKKKQILEGMDERISDIKETTNQIEAPPEHVRKAITVGTSVTQKAAQDALEQKSKQSSFNRFVSSDDD